MTSLTADGCWHRIFKARSIFQNAHLHCQEDHRFLNFATVLQYISAFQTVENALLW